MRDPIIILALLAIIVSHVNCNPKLDQQLSATSHSAVDLQLLNETLTHVLIKDQFNPPVASRIYSYANLAYYESLISGTKEKSFDKYINGLPKNNETKINNELLAKLVFVNIGSELTFSQSHWNILRNKINEEYQGMEKGIQDLTIQASESYSSKILEWASEDGFGKRLTYIKYKVDDHPSLYQLTPPSYKSPIEPYWGTLRLFLLKDIASYSCEYDYQYSENETSSFYQVNYDLFDLSKNISEEDINTALFWDCNPVQVDMIGHAMRYNFRMTPSSHWVSILNIISKNKVQKPELEAFQYALLTMTMADAFIVCWHDKYKYNTVRPVTYINKNMDEFWMPVIETPNFPEYPSGHSTVSKSASVILSRFYGSDYTFTDDSQKRFKMKPRTFNSFEEAAIEAGESRILGGIHYRDAIDDGIKQGDKIGTFIWENIALD